MLDYTYGTYFDVNYSLCLCGNLLCAIVSFINAKLKENIFKSHKIETENILKQSI